MGSKVGKPGDRKAKQGNRLFISEVGEIASAEKAKREQEKSWILEKGTL